VRGSGNIARLQFGFLVLIVVIVVFVLVATLARAGTGRKMIAVRSNERAAASIGINVARIKLQTFGLSSFLAGLGGALIGYSQGQLSAASFSALVGLGVLATAYVGGIASLSGAFVAGTMSSVGIAFVFLDSELSLGNYHPLLTGLALVITVVLNPVGVTGGIRRQWDRVARWRTDRPAPTQVAGEREPTGHVRLRPAPARVQRQIGDVLLRTEHITVTYRGLTAVNEVSLEVRAGEIVGLIGPNGAGKTSFIDAITGFAPSRGDVYLKGENVSSLPAYRRARRGLVRSWQSGELFGDLSVEGKRAGRRRRRERSAANVHRHGAPQPRSVTGSRGCHEIDGIGRCAQRKPGELSLGREKPLGVARSLALKPAVLLLDEPAAGLDSIESLEFGADLQRIAATGVGCLLIDHDMNLVLGMCDRVYVIEFGRQIAHGAPDEVRRDPKVVAAYLGSSSFDELSDNLAESAPKLSAGDPFVATQGQATP